MASLADMVRQNKMQSIPQDKLLGGLSSGLGAVRNFGNKVNVPYLGGMGDMFLGKSPEEIENWSYGNSPFQSTEMGLPQIKRERKQSLVDALSALTPMAKMTEGLPVGMSIKDISKNLNSDLLQKYLTTGKLSLKEMAQYEANGLAMETPQLQRYNLGNANAQGGSPAHKAIFDTYGYHQSDADNIKYFDNKKLGLNTVGNAANKTIENTSKIGHWFSGKPLSMGNNSLNMFGNTTYPVLLNNIEPAELSNSHQLFNQLDEYGLKKFKKNLDDYGHDSIIINKDVETGLPSIVQRDPKNIRSRFAAFDPLRKNSSSLLASLLGGTALVGQYNKEKKMKEMR